MPNRRALIVIDVQNDYVTGDLPIEFPDVRLSLRNIGRAMDAARAHAVPLVVVQNTAPQGSPIFAKDSSGWKLHPTVEQRPCDHYIEKTLPSAFAGTDLEAWLQAYNIGTLSVIGYMTQKPTPARQHLRIQPTRAHAAVRAGHLHDPAQRTPPYRPAARGCRTTGS